MAEPSLYFSILESGGENLAEADGTLTASGTATAYDPDPSDTLIASSNLSAVNGSAAMSAGRPTDLALQSMFTVTAGPIAADDPAASGNVGWNFNSGATTFDFLADGETLELVYRLTVTDHSNASTSEFVTIKITGTNDAPSLYFSILESGGENLTETNGTLTASGTATAFDADLSDSLVASSNLSAVNGSAAMSPGRPTNLALQGMFTVTAGPIAADDPAASGNVGWNFNSGATTFDFLAAGETLELVYRLTVTDQSNVSTSEFVTIKITGTNDAPTAAASGTSHIFTENGPPLALVDAVTIADVDNSRFGGGTLTFGASDGGPGDGYTILGSFGMDYDPGAGTIEYNGRPLATVTGPGQLLLTSNADAEAVETLIRSLAFTNSSDDPVGGTRHVTITFTDGSGTADGGHDSVTIAATVDVIPVNDPPRWSLVGTDAATADLHEADGSLATSGTLTVNDPELADAVTLSIASASATGNSAGLPPTWSSMLSLPSGSIAADPGDSHNVVWSFDSGAFAFDYLSAGQTVTLDYILRATDGGSATADEHVVITIHGTNDAPTAAASGTSHIFTENGPPLALVDAVTIADVDNSRFGGGTLTFGASDGGPGDGYTILGSFGMDYDPGAGTIEYNGRPLATVTGPGQLLLTSNADAEAVETLIRSLAFTNSSDDPAGGTRHVTITFTDGSGTADGGHDSVTIAATVDVIPVNDPPRWSLVGTDAATADLHEADGSLATSGTLTVNDPELADAVTLSIASASATGNSAGLPPTWSSMLSLPSGSIAADPGDSHNVVWSFDSGAFAFDYLDEGETVTLTYSVVATDGSGATASQDVTVTITGTNDAPVIGIGAGDSAGASLTETDSALAAGGTLTVIDPDLSDAVTTSLVSVVAGGTTAGLGSNNAALAAMLGLTPSLAADAGSAGNLAWSWNSVPEAFDYLGLGETLSLTYTIRVTDDSGAWDDQAITITIAGSNDAPVIVPPTDAFGTVTELADHAPGENVATLSDSGTIFFADRDLTDMHSSSWTAQSGGYLGTFTLGPVNQGADKVGWSFSVSDAALNSLGDAVVLKQYYDVTIDDGHGGTVTQTVEVDLHGTNDAAILTSANVIVPQGPAPVSASGDLDISDEDDPALFVVQSNTAGHYGHFSIDADGNWSYLADAAYILGPNEVLSEVFTVLAVDGTPTTVAVTIQGIDQPGAAHDDLFTTNESSVIGAGRNLFADNGSGPDSDPDTSLVIGAVNGNPANVGHSLLLASGARVIVNSNGTFSYDTNGAWTGLSGLMGASNHFGHDSFTYTLAGGGTATVYMNIVGEVTPGDVSYGSGGDDDILGSSANDTIRLDQDGSDHATGEGGNDGFYFGSRLDHGDSVDGGEGNDTVALQGNTNVVLGDIRNVEVIALLSGSNAAYGDTANNRYDYSLTANDGNVGAGETLTVIGTALLPGEDLHFDGSAETDGNFRIFAGQGVDDLTGGAGNDGFFFGADGNLTGADHVNGGAGTDSIALRGNYVGANAVVFQDGSFENVEVLAMLSGHSNEYGGVIVPGGYDYDVTMANGNVAGGRTFDVSATGLKADESLRFDGRLETDAFFRIFSGAGNDTLYGGGQNDMLYGGLGKDWMEGGPGADTYIFRSAAESTGIGYDTISGFDYTADRIDAPGGGSRSFSQSATGNLSLGSFDADLASGLSGVLGAGQAALFTASGGSLAGHIFAVIDVNGVAGYQAGEDLVIELVNPVLPIDPHAGVIV